MPSTGKGGNYIRQSKVNWNLFEPRPMFKLMFQI